MSKTAWLGNSAPVAMKHYAMAMQDSFDRAIREGASPASVVKLHQNPHQSEPVWADQDGLNQNPHQLAELEKAANRVICGLVTLADELASCPIRTAPTAENAGFSAVQGQRTPKSTPQHPAELIAACIRRHLDADQLDQLLQSLLQSHPGPFTN